LQHRFLVHDLSDNVGVAVAAIGAGERVAGVALEDGCRLEIEARSDIPLGHKVALASIGAGEPVIEYGVPIGKAIQPIAVGEHVHVHNLRSARW